MSPRLTRLELGLVVSVFVIGFGLRAASPSRMAVEHFDEGVYASNLYTPEGRFPFQHLYAPPLVPVCLEGAAIFGGPHAVMWVNVVSGSLTLLVLWGMVRAWWGPPAAVAAMTLLAFNEFHIAYSRAALTDAMLGLWMTAGVWAGWRAVQLGGSLNIAAAGVLAALAWWTKYNGWLTLAITGSGTAGWLLLGRASSVGQRQPSAGPRGPRRGAPKTDTVIGAARLQGGRWAFIAAIAFLLWAPWLWDLQQYGGYTAVARNHAGYFTGLGQWWSNAVRQCAAVASLSHWLTQTGVVLAVIAAIVLSCRRPAPEAPPVTGQASDTGHSATWIAAAWLIGLSVAVPLYQPYPRLCLPWLVGLAVVLGGVMARGVTWDGSRPRVRPVGLVTTVVVGALFCAGLTTRSGKVGCWETRTGLQKVSVEIIAALQSQDLSRDVDGARCIVAVVAEPGLFFHLSAAQQRSPIAHVTVPVADFSFAAPGANKSGLPAYLVVGPGANQVEADQLIADGRAESLAEFDYRPSDLVLLDIQPAWDLPPSDRLVVERIRLLHVKP